MSGQLRKPSKISVEIEEIHENTSTQLITITTDKLHLILIDHLKRVEDSKAWQAPLGIVITIVLVFCSAQFRDAFGLPADTWRAIFLIAGVVSVAWLIYTLVRIRKGIKIDHVIGIIKNKTSN